MDLWVLGTICLMCSISSANGVRGNFGKPTPSTFNVGGDELDVFSKRTARTNFPTALSQTSNNLGFPGALNFNPALGNTQGFTPTITNPNGLQLPSIQNNQNSFPGLSNNIPIVGNPIPITFSNNGFRFVPMTRSGSTGPFSNTRPNLIPSTGSGTRVITPGSPGFFSNAGSGIIPTSSSSLPSVFGNGGSTIRGRPGSQGFFSNAGSRNSPSLSPGSPGFFSNAGSGSSPPLSPGSPSFFSNAGSGNTVSTIPGSPGFFSNAGSNNLPSSGPGSPGFFSNSGSGRPGSSGIFNNNIPNFKPPSAGPCPIFPVVTNFQLKQVGKI